MPYKSPIHLLTPAQAQSFQVADLKKIKNELLLQFQFSSEAIIEIHSRPYDKDEVLQLLEELQTNAPLHLAVFQNKPALQFLEEKKLPFFGDAQSQLTINSGELAPEMQKLIAEGINEFVEGIILKFTPENTRILETISRYMATLPPDLKSIAYQDAFIKFKVLVDQLKERYPVPFTNEDNYKFHPELTEILNREVITFFRFLPGEFQYCQQKLGAWCNNNVVMPFTEREGKVKNWDKHSLELVVEAAVIASTIFNKDGNLQVANNISDYLHAKKERSGSGGSFSIVLFIIGLIIGIGKCALSTNRSNDYNRPTYEQPQMSSELQVDLLERQLNNLNAKTYLSPSEMQIRDALEGQLEAYTGQKGGYVDRVGQMNGKGIPLSKSYTWKEVRWSDDREKVTLIAEEDILPAHKKWWEVMPSEVKEAGTKNPLDVELVFQKKGIPEVKFIHLFKLNKLDVMVTGKKVPGEDGSGETHVLPFTQSGIKWKGLVTLYDQKGLELDRDTVLVEKVPGADSVVVKLNKKVVNWQNNQDISDPNLVRMQTMMQNTKVVTGITLDASTSISYLNYYDFSHSITGKAIALDRMTIHSVRSNQEKLVYNLSGGKNDQLQDYYSLTGTAFQVNVIIDVNTNTMTGFQMASKANNGQYIERIELYKVK